MKQSWRAAILAEFVPGLTPLTLVADPDSLLSDERIQQTLQERGYEVVEYEDPIAFRYMFETTYRTQWEAGEPIELAIVLRAGQRNLHQLPYDLLRSGRQLAVSLSSLFPGMTYNEVAALERGELDALYTAQTNIRPGSLGENKTRDFVLRHVFGVDSELVKDEADLLAMLLRLHLRKRPLPAPFADRLRLQLQRDDRFTEWPLDTLLADPSVLFAFLQERWPIYLDQQAFNDERQLHDTIAQRAYDLQWPGPPLLPFGKPDIRAFVDTLFLEGKLRPVMHSMGDKLKHLWVTVGLQSDPALDRELHLARLLNQLELRLPSIKARYQEWLTFAAAWAEAIVLRHMPLAEISQPISEQFDALQVRLDSAFGEWLLNRYKYLSTSPPCKRPK